VLDLLWDPAKLAFYDFNTTARARNGVLSAASFYPVWAGILPDELLAPASNNGTGNAYRFFASLHMVLARYNGTYPPTFLESGLQWDAPNAWPPHQYILMQALRALPANVSAAPLPAPPQGASVFALLPAGQAGVAEGALPAQGGTGAAGAVGPAADINAVQGGFVNGGNATAGEGWRDALVRALANRCVAVASLGLWARA
jgi:alpha,alpha-trehalase